MEFNLQNFSDTRQNDLIEQLSTGYGLLAEYSVNGITYKSNNINIIPRDPAGNIIVQPNSDLNKILVIEPVVKRVNLPSILKVYDTSFQYYKFPVSVISTETEDLDVNIDFDTISTRYVIPYQEYPAGVPNSYRRLNTSYESGWYVNDDPAVGSVSGFTRLPFTGANQSEPGAFSITPSILKLLQDEGKTIKFSVQMLGTPRNTSDNTGFSLRIRRDNPSAYRNWELPTVYTTTKGEFNSGDYPLLKIDYIVNLEDIIEYDKFSIEAVAGGPAWYLGDSTYWDLQVIDNVPGLLENSFNGVTSVSAKTRLTVNGNEVISGQ